MRRAALLHHAVLFFFIKDLKIRSGASLPSAPHICAFLRSCGKVKPPRAITVAKTAAARKTKQKAAASRRRLLGCLFPHDFFFHQFERKSVNPDRVRKEGLLPPRDPVCAFLRSCGKVKPPRAITVAKTAAARKTKRKAAASRRRLLGCPFPHDFFFHQFERKSVNLITANRRRSPILQGIPALRACP